MKQYPAYAIITKSGKILVDTCKPISFGKHRCIENFMDVFEIAGSWADAQKKGYDCVRVNVSIG